MSDAVSATADVPIAPDEAFALFTTGLGSWWPREFSWSQDVLEEIGMETHEGGFLYETGPHGLRLDWGRVLTWAPPGKLVFSWQISPERVPEPNPARASEVEVRFEPSGSGCRVLLQHRGFERHGGDGDGYAEMMRTQGWPLALERFAGAAAGRSGA
jgi:uncharacterized protein YndB with AHSA1/START domain